MQVLGTRKKLNLIDVIYSIHIHLFLQWPIIAISMSKLAVLIIETSDFIKTLDAVLGFTQGLTTDILGNCFYYQIAG